MSSGPGRELESGARRNPYPSGSTSRTPSPETITSWSVWDWRMAKMSSCFLRPAAPSTFIFLSISVNSPIRIPFSSFRFMHALPGTWVFSDAKREPPSSTGWKNGRKALQRSVVYRRMCAGLVQESREYRKKYPASIPYINKTQLPGRQGFFAAEGVEEGREDRAAPRRLRLHGADPGV